MALAHHHRRAGLRRLLRESRGVLWRWRHLFAALALACVGLLALEAAVPPPPGEPALVLAGPVPAGRPLTAADLRAVPLPDDARAASVLRAPREAVGARLAVGLPAGAVLTREMLVGDALEAPPGHVVVPVTLADPGSESLARPGNRVIVVVPDDASGRVELARGVLVLALLAPDDAPSLVPGVTQSTIALVAVPADVASLVLRASSTAPVRIALAR